MMSNIQRLVVSCLCVRKTAERFRKIGSLTALGISIALLALANMRCLLTFAQIFQKQPSLMAMLIIIDLNPAVLLFTLLNSVFYSFFIIIIITS